VAGDPDDEELIWTYLSTTEIADQLADLGTPVCRHTVAGLLDNFGLSQRKIQKAKTMGHVEHRDEQFQIIARRTREYEHSPNPIVSMDTKRKEFLGDFARPGTAYGNASDRAWDHDFASHAKGVVIPHGLYDQRRNVGHITVGTSRDTSEFACDSFLWWWRHCGRHAWPKAERILLKCDGGGSNSSRHYIFKEDLQRLSNRIGLPLEVMHYPPYCSKYNPIEHRMFPHVQRAWSGVMLRSYDIVTECLGRVWTSTGLWVTVKLMDKAYALGRTASEAFMEAWPIQFADKLPQWNYTVVPTTY
jgi:hypothetical protein